MGRRVYNIGKNKDSAYREIMQESLATTPTTISAKTAMSKAWNLLQDKYPIIILVICWQAVRNILIFAAILTLTVSIPQSPVIMLVTIILLSAESSAEFFWFTLKLVRNEPYKLFQLPSPLAVVNWFSATTLTTLSVYLGIFALILPGLVLGVFFSTTGYAAVDGFGPIQSIKLSWRIASSAFWQIALVFFTMLSLMVIPIGLTVACNFMLVLALAFFYTTSSAHAESVTVKKND